MSLKLVINRYLNQINKSEWRWVSLSENNDVHYLFVNKNQTMISAYGYNELHYHSFTYVPHKIFDYGNYKYVMSDVVDDVFSVFTIDLKHIYTPITIEWINSNMRLDPRNTPIIGGKVRV